jgi:hypothetical protein
MTTTDNIVGRRVRLIQTDDRYTKLKTGSMGTVTGFAIDTFFGDTTTHVKWDDGSNLSLLSSVDIFEILPERDAFLEQFKKFIVEGVKLIDMWPQSSDEFENELNSHSWPFTMSLDEVMCELVDIYGKIHGKVDDR